MQPRSDRTDVRPMVIGGLLGGGAGFALWMTTDIFVFLPVLLAVGLVVGITMGLERTK
jgi:hypothetical protein